MIEPIIKPQTAKLAKEKGLKLSFCVHLYNQLDTCIEMSCDSAFVEDRDWYLAPSQTIMQKYLREKRKVECYAYPFKDHADDPADPFHYRAFRCGAQEFNTFEEALEASLIKGLEAL